MGKFIQDTVMINGRYAQKKVLAYGSFVVSTLYAFLPAVLMEFEVKEFVFLGFLAIGGFFVYRNQKVDENNLPPLPPSLPIPPPQSSSE